MTESVESPVCYRFIWREEPEFKRDKRSGMVIGDLPSVRGGEEEKKTP